MRKRVAAVLCVVGLAFAACGGEDGEAEDPLAGLLVDAYDCGFGFYLGTADQAAGLFLVFTDFEVALAGGTPDTSALPHADWVAEVQIGSHLFTSWCDDTTPDPGQEPVVAETWPVVSGTITILEQPAPGVCGQATARLESLTAQKPDGTTIVLGDFEVGNRAFGCVSG